MLNQRNLSLVDIHLSQEENTILDRIKIFEDFGHTDYYGASLTEVKALMSKIVSECGTNNFSTANTAASIVCRHIEWMRTKHNADYFWLAVRTSPMTNAFDVPRWHKDGKYFLCERKVYKLVQSLIGPQSRFAEIKDLSAFSQLEQIQMTGDDSIELRQALDGVVKEFFPTQSSRQAVEFLVGDPNAVVHSEPPIRIPRLFYSVVVGSKDEISFFESR